LSEELILKRLVEAAPQQPPRNGSGGAIPANGSAAASPPVSARETSLNTLRAWSGMLDDEYENDDRKVATWYEENKKTIYSKIEALKTESVALDVAQLLMSNKDGGLKGVQQVLSMLPVEERESVLKYLSS
jgi:acetyl-CoA carboxylase/biotin carboxylase 1